MKERIYWCNRDSCRLLAVFVENELCKSFTKIANINYLLQIIAYITFHCYLGLWELSFSFLWPLANFESSPFSHWLLSLAVFRVTSTITLFILWWVQNNICLEIIICPQIHPVIVIVYQNYISGCDVICLCYFGLICTHLLTKTGFGIIAIHYSFCLLNHKY